MDKSEVIKILRNEETCVRAADNCGRDCANCHLVMDDKAILEAYETAIEILTAQPEIIQCKGCGYYDPADNDEESDWCHAWGETTEENAFCSYAERRTDG